MIEASPLNVRSLLSLSSKAEVPVASEIGDVHSQTLERSTR